MKKNSKYIILLIFIIVTLLIGNINNTEITKAKLQTTISSILRTVKIREEKYEEKYKNTKIIINIPQENYTDKKTEKYINTYIRKDINGFINNQKQKIDTLKEYNPIDIKIKYHVVYDDGKLFNIVIYKDITYENKKQISHKDSYVFNLQTGQRIYLDDLLNNNKDKILEIERYINKIIKTKKYDTSKRTISINRETQYLISDYSISIFFNPYRESDSREVYEFKIPNEMLEQSMSDKEKLGIYAVIDMQTIIQNNKYLNSILNIPIIITNNKRIDKDINDKVRQDIMSYYTKVEKEGKEFLIYPIQNKFIINVDFKINKNTPYILSLATHNYSYNGGAHGYYEEVSYNIDMKNGSILKFKELFKENSDYISIISNQIRNQIKENKEYQGYEFEQISEIQKFYIINDKLIIYFDLYEIAPYVAGIPKFEIQIDEINHIIKEKYLNLFE